jgi:hypothetical protein
VFLDGLFSTAGAVPANLPVGRDLTIRRKIENRRYYCAFGRSKAMIESGHHVALLKPSPGWRYTKPFMRIPIGRRSVSMSVRESMPDTDEEKIAGCQPPPVSDPALRQMVRPIVQHVAALDRARADCWSGRYPRAPLRARRASSETESGAVAASTATGLALFIEAAGDAEAILFMRQASTRRHPHRRHDGFRIVLVLKKF